MINVRGIWRKVGANLRSDEQKSHQAIVKDKVAAQAKSNNYSELAIVNVADRWRERNVVPREVSSADADVCSLL